LALSICRRSRSVGEHRVHLPSCVGAGDPDLVLERVAALGVLLGQCLEASLLESGPRSSDILAAGASIGVAIQRAERRFDLDSLEDSRRAAEWGSPR